MTLARPRIGIDFDNTIACYSKALISLSKEYLDLPDGLPLNKTSIRDYLRSVNRENEWTEFQGFLYGPGMASAKTYPGCVSSLVRLCSQPVDLFIISHRTASPYAGPKYDLHAAANQWISSHLTLSGQKNSISSMPIIPSSNIYFLEHKSEKIQKIAELGIDYFLDDLPSILLDPSFPRDTCGILFDPSSSQRVSLPQIPSVANWSEFYTVIENHVSKIRNN
jgi:hypothetical protein